MENQNASKQSRLSLWLLGGCVLVLLTFLVLLQTSNLWKDFSVDTASDTLLLYALSSLNFIAFIIFGFIFLRSIIKLTRERRTLQVGAKIKTRLLIYFFAVSVLPIVAMAVFSYLFMNRALDRWFTQIPENVIREAREVQSQAVADQYAKVVESAKMLGAVLRQRELTKENLDNVLAAGNLTLIEVISKAGATIARSERQLVPEQKAELDRTLAIVKQGVPGPIVNDGRGFDVVITDLADGRKLLIVPEFLAEESVSQIVDNSLIEFDRLKEKQVNVRRVGLLTLGVLTFLLIFASSWTAFYIARGLTVPIKALAEGADEIARGNLAHRVNVVAEDELALLVGTFNQMSAKLEENSAELGERRRYIETVLQSLPTGVISFDPEFRVTTMNKAAGSILELEDGDFSSIELEKLVSEENRVVIERLLARARRVGHAAEQTVFQRENGTGKAEDSGLPVALTATALPANGGVVLVIEDLSELIAAQRASAWREVARRMAHEIKNPLTPIQLSAERIAKRFAAAVEKRKDEAEMPVKQAETRPVGSVSVLPANSSFGMEMPTAKDQTANVVKEGTDTILREVQSLKAMVDEFSRFARLPNATLEEENLNDIIGQVVTLYEDRSDHVSLSIDLAKDLPHSMLDAEQMKRVFVNLIENAIEAFGESGDDRTVTIKTRHDAPRDLIVAEVSDNGKGIAPSDLQKLFQPYFSTKGRGTGLGLAIVSRIVSDHRGKIKVVANQPRGAKFIVEIPVSG